MKILITGADGQLGRALKKKIDRVHNTLYAIDSKECDVTDKLALERVILPKKPDVIIHCAAYTAVDKAEIERELCRKINVEGTENVMSICKIIDAEMVFFSTDYVFDGNGSIPYEIDAKMAPINEYGKSKMLGECLVRENMKKYFIIRTSWMFGDGPNFVQKILSLSRENKIVNVVCDQIGSPTFSEDLAEALYRLIQTQQYGTYHITNEGFCSWADIAEEAIRASLKDTTINHILSSDYLSKAKRPLNSRLSKNCLDKINLGRLPDWKDGLKRYLLNCKE